MPLPVRWRYKLDRWRSQIAGMFQSEPKTNAPETLPGLRHAGRRNGDQVPSVRREHDVFLRRGEQIARPLDAADFSGDVRHADDLLRDVRAVVRDHDEIFRRRGAGGGLMNLGGIATQVNYRLGASLPLAVQHRAQPWRFVTAIFLHGGLLHIGFNMWVLMDIGPMVEELYGSARYFFLFVATGAVGYVVSSLVGTLERRRLRLAAGTDRRAARRDNGPEEPGRRRPSAAL